MSGVEPNLPKQEYLPTSTNTPTILVQGLKGESRLGLTPTPGVHPTLPWVTTTLTG